MKKYRIKQIGDKYFPQYKKNFGWGHYKGKPYLDWGTTSFLTGQKVTFYEDLYFESLEEVNNFLIKI